MQTGKYELVKVSELEVSKHNLRKEIKKDESYEELKKSIMESGIIFPLMITSDNKIITGQRRFTVAKEIGMEKVPVIRLPFKEDEIDGELISFIENYHRSGLSKEELRDYATKLFNKFGNLSRVAKILGVAVSTVSNWVAVERIEDEELKDKLRQLPVTHQVKAVKKIKKERMRIKLDELKKMSPEELKREIASQTKRELATSTVPSKQDTYSLEIEIPMDIWKRLKEMASREMTLIPDLIIKILREYFDVEEISDDLSYLR